MADELRPASPVALRQTREKTIHTLTRHFADDHLEVAEFESRLDAAWRATSLAELDGLTADLPALRQETVPAPAPAPTPVPARADEPASRRFLGAVMGGVSRTGEWEPPRTVMVFAFMGGAELDFREARMLPGITEVQVFTIMGGVEITVPPDLPMEVDGFAFMGGFEQPHGRRRQGNEPALRITGFAMMGGVEVRVRLPRETESDYKRRRREEKRALRRGGS